MGRVRHFPVMVRPATVRDERNGKPARGEGNRSTAAYTVANECVVREGVRKTPLQQGVRRFTSQAGNRALDGHADGGDSWSHLPHGSDPIAPRDALVFWGAVLALVALTLAALVQVGAILTRAPSAAGPEPLAPPIPATLTASVVDGNVKSYTLPNPDAGLMQPALDAQGNVWVGEMTANRLAKLDPTTGQVQSWEPPNALHTIMATQGDAQGRVYFTEQAGNYIGRFDPATQTFKTFDLGESDGRKMAPQDLRFDASGKLWVTLAGAGRIGRLDPTTGAFDSWPVPAPAAGVASTPWALAISSGGTIWFGMLSGGAVGRLDPGSGQVRLIHLADPKAQIFSMAADGQGRVYFTELQAAKLGVIETATGKVQELDVPSVLGDAESLYAVACSNGDAWFASSGANAIVRFDPQAGTFRFYQLPVPNSIPYGLAVDASGTVWFAADDVAGNYIGALTP